MGDHKDKEMWTGWYLGPCDDAEDSQSPPEQDYLDPYRGETGSLVVLGDGLDALRERVDELNDRTTMMVTRLGQRL